MTTTKHALQIVIDDVGWFTGHDESKQNRPFRTGVNRKHVLQDYIAIAELGKRLGVRPVIAMVIGDWDRDNILKDITGATWDGDKWDNRENIKQYQTQLESIIDFLNNNQDYFEISMHGLQHEYWTNGMMTRSQYFDHNKYREGNGKFMRPYDIVNSHVDAFFKILDRNGVKAKVRTIVPPNFNYECGENGNAGDMSKILKNYGLEYVNTPFSMLQGAPDSTLHYEEAGLTFIDRGPDDIRWNATNIWPTKDVHRPTFGLHWANILGANHADNLGVVDKWVAFFQGQVAKGNITLAKDIKECAEQLMQA